MEFKSLNPLADSPALNTMLHDPNVKVEGEVNEAANAQETASQDDATGANESAEEGTIEG
jgi:hypothetical protein